MAEEREEEASGSRKVRGAAPTRAGFGGGEGGAAPGATLPPALLRLPAPPPHRASAAAPFPLRLPWTVAPEDQSLGWHTLGSVPGAAVGAEAAGGVGA